MLNSFVKCFLAVSFILAFSASEANAQTVVGTRNCFTPVPCEPTEWSSDQWADAGDACLRRSFGISSAEGVIDRNYGLDGSNRLTTNMNSIQRTEDNTTIIPECSVFRTRSDTCAIRCILKQH